MLPEFDVDTGDPRSMPSRRHTIFEHDFFTTTVENMGDPPLASGISITGAVLPVHGPDGY
jgi:hypothetical protein